MNDIRFHKTPGPQSLGRTLLMSAVRIEAGLRGLPVRRESATDPNDEHVLCWDGPEVSVFLHRHEGKNYADPYKIGVFVPWVTAEPTWRRFQEAAVYIVEELARRLDVPLGATEAGVEVEVEDLLTRAGIPREGTLEQRVRALLRAYASLAASTPPAVEPTAAARAEAYLKEVMQALGTQRMESVVSEVRRLQAAVVRADHGQRCAVAELAVARVRHEQYLANTSRAIFEIPPAVQSRPTPDGVGWLPERVFVLPQTPEGHVTLGIALAARSDGNTMEYGVLLCNEFGDPLLRLGLSWVDADRIRQSPYPLLPR